MPDVIVVVDCNEHNVSVDCKLELIYTRLAGWQLWAYYPARLEPIMLGDGFESHQFSVSIGGVKVVDMFMGEPVEKEER